MSSEQRARAAQKRSSLMVTLSDTELPVTEDIGKYKADTCQVRIVGFLDSSGYRDSGKYREG